ncbi:hypothetical protein [Corallococcus exiguus]|uniref:hypothetical protein n=1 Tax=Corallococcus exiguus TaxID=83462 RepID=UPI0015603C33|nr:hypothetical protein [Corallococcus exiguus]NRD45968.1 hypothetical protein [Corallococcus exiguus]
MAKATRNSGVLDLFGATVEQLKTVVDGPLVRTENSSNACIARSDDGRLWVRKRRRDMDPPTAFLAEVLGWMLAQELGVPIPQGAICGQHDEAELSWLSEVVPLASHWDRSRANFVQNYDVFGRVLALDAIAYNPDRRKENILLQPVDKVGSQAFCIDLGHSLLGRPNELAAAGLHLPEIEFAAEGLPLPLLRDGARAAAEKAQHCTHGLLDHMVAGACRISGVPDRRNLLAALWNRMRNAQDLTERYLGKLEENEKTQ